MVVLWWTLLGRKGSFGGGEGWGFLTFVRVVVMVVLSVAVKVG